MRSHLLSPLTHFPYPCEPLQTVFHPSPHRGVMGHLSKVTVDCLTYNTVIVPLPTWCALFPWLLWNCALLIVLETLFPFFLHIMADSCCYSSILIPWIVLTYAFPGGLSMLVEFQLTPVCPWPLSYLSIERNIDTFPTQLVQNRIQLISSKIGPFNV